MTSGRRGPGGPGTLTDAAGPGTRQELRGSSRKNGLGAPTGGKRGPTGRMGRKGSRSPQDLPSGRCHPSAGGKETASERAARHGSGVWPHYLVGPGVVHREGQGAGMRGAASVEERAAG